MSPNLPTPRSKPMRTAPSVGSSVKRRLGLSDPRILVFSMRPSLMAARAITYKGGSFAASSAASVPQARSRSVIPANTVRLGSTYREPIRLPQLLDGDVTELHQAGRATPGIGLA